MQENKKVWVVFGCPPNVGGEQEDKMIRIFLEKENAEIFQKELEQTSKNYRQAGKDWFDQCIEFLESVNFRVEIHEEWIKNHPEQIRPEFHFDHYVILEKEVF